MQTSEKGSLEDFLRRWWSKKYSLPGNDERFERSSLRDLLVELHMDMLDRREELMQQLNDSPSDQPLVRARLREAIASLDKALDELGSGAKVGSADAVVDQWDEMLDRGEDPEDLFELDPGIIAALERRKKKRK